MSTIPQQGIIKYQEVVRVRRSGGGWVNSRYVDGTEELSETIKASVQNPTRKGSEVILNMSEGERHDSWKVAYCAVGTFRISDDELNIQSDLLIWDGWYWDVRKINTWKGQILTHDQVYLVRTDRRYIPPPEVLPVFSSYGGAFASYSDIFASPEESSEEGGAVLQVVGNAYSSYDNDFAGV